MKTKPIFNSYLAKQLLKKGNQIVDLKKNYEVANATVFFFEDNEKLNNDINELMPIIRSTYNNK